MLVELIVLDMAQNTVLSLMPICSLNMISKSMPKTNKTVPIIIETFRYLVTSIFLLITWDKIRNSPKIPKNMMSFPFEDPIKNKYVIGLIIGSKIFVRKIIPARNMTKNPNNIVLLIFINNNLISNTLNK